MGLGDVLLPCPDVLTIHCPLPVLPRLLNQASPSHLTQCCGLSTRFQRYHLVLVFIKLCKRHICNL